MIDLSALELVLPDYARPDLATFERRDIPRLSGQISIAEMVPQSSMIEVLTSLRFTAATNAVVKTRNTIVQYLDGDGLEYFAVQGAHAMQANETYIYLYSVASNYALDSTALYSTQGIPLLPILPGHKLIIGMTNGEATDSINFVRATVLRIPTGPALRSLPGFEAPLDPRTLVA